MTDSDHDLQRMFQAQRLIDETLAPPFADLADTTPSVAVAPPVSRWRKPMLVAVAVAAAAACLAIAMVAWNDPPNADAPQSPADTALELRELNLLCDALIETIDKTDAAMDLRSSHGAMEWPSGTASLLPFDALSFNFGRNER